MPRDGRGNGGDHQVIDAEANRLPRASFGNTVRLLIRLDGTLRKFLTLQVAKGDGSLYVALGHPAKNARVANVQATIPVGERSASVDFTQHITREFSDLLGSHVGFKASGMVISRFGEQAYRSENDVPPAVGCDVLLQTIYPARLDHLPVVTTPRKSDLIIPDRLDYRRVDWVGGDLVDACGTDPFHVEIWQLPPTGGVQGQVEAGQTVFGAMTIDAGERPLIIAFVQDEIDRQRGWSDRTVVLMPHPPLSGESKPAD